MSYTREQVIAGFRRCIAQRRLIVGAGSGSGISAKSAEAGGADVLMVYNSGRYRMAGRSSVGGMLPLEDANEIVLRLAGEIVPVVGRVPVFAGVNATDFMKCMDRLLTQIMELGYSGILNFPTVGLYDGKIRRTLEETGNGFEKEVDLIALAHRRDIFTAAYAFNEEESELMTKAGADMVICHVGGSRGGTVGVKTYMSLDEACDTIQAIQKTAAKINPDIIMLVHGGPIVDVPDVEYVMRHTEGIHGFYGSSSAERIPLETAITEQTRRFKRICINRDGRADEREQIGAQ